MIFSNIKRPQQIFINGRFLTQRFTGVQRFALSCALNLQEIFGERVVIVTPKGELSHHGKKFINLKQVGIGNGHIWEQVFLPLFLLVNTGGPLFCFCGLPPLLRSTNIYCIHDMAVFRFPNAFKRKYGLFYRAMVRLALHRTKAIMCVSNFTRDELKTILGYDNAYIVSNVVEKLVTENNQIQNSPITNLGEKPYALFVGSIEPRKNLYRLLEAVNSPDWPSLHLVIIGAPGDAFPDQNLKANEQCTFLGYVSDEELAVAYSNACCFIYPSLYEGFGIPPLEAMQFGCPVLVSEAASLPEVCGDAAIYFDPNDTVSIVKAINQVFDIQQDRIDSLVAEGYRRVERFSNQNQREQLEYLSNSLNIDL